MDLNHVLEALSESALIAVTQELIRLNSVNPPGHEEAVCRVIAERAIAWGLEAEVQPLESGRANVIVRLRGTQAGPAILYCGHLDTVPAGERSWDHGPFSGDLVDGRIWGRGATDMKGGVAAMLVAMAALRKGGAQFPGDLVFAGVAGEEVNCMGSRHFLMNQGMKNVGWLVVGEPTNLDLVIAHKGALHIEARTHGRAAHGSMPHLGTNAILHMAKFIKRLSGLTLEAPTHPLLSPPTMSINMIRGGERTNVVPDMCSVSIDIRTIPGQHHLDILAALRKEALALRDEVPDFHEEFQVIHESAPVETSADHPFIFAAKRASRKVLGRDPRVRGVTYFTDASILQPPTGIPTLIFGPGDEGMAHQCNEYLEVRFLAAASRFFAALPFEIFGGIS